MIRAFAADQKAQLIEDAIRRYNDTGEGVYIAADAQFNSAGFCAALGTVGLMDADSGEQSFFTNMQ